MLTLRIPCGCSALPPASSSVASPLGERNILFQDGEGNTLLMQPKQASQSVLAEYGKIEQPTALSELIETSGEGARVVSMQRILQALSDPFLGHVRSPNGDFYARQFHDMKGAIEVEELADGPFVTYARACAATLARAHSQSVTATEVAGYVVMDYISGGSGRSFRSHPGCEWAAGDGGSEVVLP